MIIRRLLCTLLTGVLLFHPVGYQTGTVTGYKEQESEEYIWQILEESSPNEFVAAGIMAYFWRESYYRSDSIAGWGYMKGTTGEDPCPQFTEEIDEADRKEFVTKIQLVGGYGLGQWYSKKHLDSLYDFCKGYGASFADAKMQCLFTIHGCVNDPAVWEQLKDANSAFEAGKMIGYLYDGSEVGAQTIAAKARQIYGERCG